MAANKCVVRNEKFVCKQNHVFEVEKVIGHREVGLLQQGSRASAEYLVLWMGFPVEDTSWQPWKNLKSCMKLVRDYHDRHSRMVSRRFLDHLQTHGMSIRKTSNNNIKAAESNGLTIQENSLYEWEVEDILGHKSLDHAKEGKKMHYLVKWIGLPEPIWTEENRMLGYDSKGYLQAYVNKEVLFGEMLGKGSNMKSFR